MYENAIRLMAKQQVALEVLSYHATAQKEEVEKLKVSSNLSLTFFNPWELKKK